MHNFYQGWPLWLLTPGVKKPSYATDCTSVSIDEVKKMFKYG
jgi:hypothetical protein